MIGTIEKVIETEDGFKIKLTAGPRYPYWKVSFEKGSVPAELAGTYTDLDKAKRAVEGYLAKRKRGARQLKQEA